MFHETAFCVYKMFSKNGPFMIKYNYKVIIPAIRRGRR